MPLYRLLISLVAPALALGAFWRLLRGREDVEAVRARLTGLPHMPRTSIWLHGASNGELASARPLIEALLDAGHSLVVTANTVMGRDLVRRWSLPRTTATVAPLDLRWLARRCLRRARVGLYVNLENELWPNRLAAARALRTPVALVAARLSAGSAATWSRLPGAARTALAPVALLSAQDAGSEARLLDLGLAADAVVPRLDLKALHRPEAAPADPILAAFDRGATVLFASTHTGEDGPLLDAFRIARRARPGLKAILAPRHPRRGPEVARLARDRDLPHRRRSLGEPASAPLYIADSLGEMALWYGAAAVTFVGGSLVDRGGHTPHEPAAHGSAILHGAHVGNFADAYRRLDGGGGAEEVTEPEAIAAAILRHLDGSPMPQRARALLAMDADLDGLVRRLLALIRQAG